MYADLPVLNTENALQRMGDDIPLLRLLIRTLLEDAPVKLAQMHDGMREENLARACLAAHSLKGGAGTVGAERITAMAQTIERILRADNTLPTCECLHATAPDAEFLPVVLSNAQRAEIASLLEALPDEFTRLAEFAETLAEPDESPV